MRSRPPIPRCTSCWCSSASDRKRSPTCAARYAARLSPPPSTSPQAITSRPRNSPSSGPSGLPNSAGTRASCSTRSPGSAAPTTSPRPPAAAPPPEAGPIPAPRPTGGVAFSALQPPRQFLGAARCIEEGGSLTILSTVLIDTGSQLASVLFEEFKGTGNMELRLRRDLAEKRIFPAIDPAPSGTRREDLLMNTEEHAAVVSLRRALAALDSQHALELLIDKTAAPNEQFLRQVSAAR